MKKLLKYLEISAIWLVAILLFCGLGFDATQDDSFAYLALMIGFFIILIFFVRHHILKRLKNG